MFKKHIYGKIIKMHETFLIHNQKIADKWDSSLALESQNCLKSIN